jgi:hypothetical protein
MSEAGLSWMLEGQWMLKGREVDMVIEIEIDTGDRTYVVLCMYVLVL